MATKKVARKTVKKAAAKKTLAKKPPAKKTAVKRTALTKTALKKAAAKKSTTRKYSPAANKNVETEMRAMKQGKLKSGRSGKKVTNPKQAIAIGLSEARRAGKRVPPNPVGSRIGRLPVAARRIHRRVSGGLERGYRRDLAALRPSKPRGLASGRGCGRRTRQHRKQCKRGRSRAASCRGWRVRGREFPPARTASRGWLRSRAGGCCR
jgi:hypothetical protein